MKKKRHIFSTKFHHSPHHLMLKNKTKSSRSKRAQTKPSTSSCRKIKNQRRCKSTTNQSMEQHQIAQRFDGFKDSIFTKMTQLCMFDTFQLSTLQSAPLLILPPQLFLLQYFITNDNGNPQFYPNLVPHSLTSIPFGCFWTSIRPSHH